MPRLGRGPARKVGEMSLSFKMANVHGRDFSGADLRDADFKMANVSNVSFRGADLTGACFKMANLSNVDFTDALVDGIDLKMANLTGVIGLIPKRRTAAPPDLRGTPEPRGRRDRPSQGAARPSWVDDQPADRSPR